MLTYIARVGILLLWHSWFRPKAVPGQGFRICMRAWPWRCDLYRHVNNATYLRLAEDARWAWTARSGLLGHSVKKRWMFIVGGADIVYRRSIPLFSQFEIKSHVVGADGKWLFFAQDFLLSDGRVAARAIVRATVKSPAGHVSPGTVLGVIGEEVPESEPAVQSMIDLAELQLRPLSSAS